MTRVDNVGPQRLARVGASSAVLRLVRAASVASAFVLSLAGGNAGAATQPYAVDLGHTRVGFAVSHFGFSIQPGVFRDIDVRFAFDRDRPENSTLEVVIKAASVDMFYERLNERLRARDFFNVEQYPDIKFHSTGVKMIAANKAVVTGDFTLLGVTRPATFEVTLNKAAPHPLRADINALGFGATGTIDRTAYGMNAYAPMVGKDIQFTISMEANDAPAR